MANLKSQQGISDDPEDFSLTNKSVLVQNPIGIFYGTLLKADTRFGTALLTDACLLPPSRQNDTDAHMNISELAGNPKILADVEKRSGETSGAMKSPLISLTNVLAIVEIRQ